MNPIDPSSLFERARDHESTQPPPFESLTQVAPVGPADRLSGRRLSYLGAGLVLVVLTVSVVIRAPHKGDPPVELRLAGLPTDQLEFLRSPIARPRTDEFFQFLEPTWSSPTGLLFDLQTSQPRKVLPPS